jgi:RHS repeat-associated protein
MPHLSMMQWDAMNQLSAVSRQVVNNNPLPMTLPETTYYVYDGSGQRVRKVTERQNSTRKNERIYLGGFEIYRDYDGTDGAIVLERETLHIMDDQQRVALVETRTDTPTPVQLIRYQFGNHLGSASLELDEAGQVIAYEEYYPYGTTSYQNGRNSVEVNVKRYRYTGKERDEETGFTYHGARYYAPWLGRWVSCDPVGVSDGLAVFTYAHNNPMKFLDRDGRQTTPENINSPPPAQPKLNIEDSLQELAPKTHWGGQLQDGPPVPDTKPHIPETPQEVQGLLDRISVAERLT